MTLAVGTVVLHCIVLLWGWVCSRVRAVTAPCGLSVLVAVESGGTPVHSTTLLSKEQCVVVVL